MTFDRWVDWLCEIALGWLRWPPSEALAADVNAIMLGYEGDCARLQVISGTKKQGRQAPFDFRSFAAAHNAVLKSG